MVSPDSLVIIRTSRHFCLAKRERLLHNSNKSNQRRQMQHLTLFWHVVCTRISPDMTILLNKENP